MKKNLLFIAIGLFMTFGIMAQQNILKNGDFEEQGVWERVIIAGNENALKLEFGNTDDTPQYGTDGCLLMTWTDSATMKQFLMQKITLKVGETYKFSGAIKDVDTDTVDIGGWWYCLMMWPAIEDQVLTIDSVKKYPPFYAGPSGEDYDSSFLLGMGHGFDKYRYYDIDTLFGDPLNPYDYGDLVGRRQPGWKGDTTYYTVPAVMQRSIDLLPLGNIGDDVDYWFIINLGQWGTNHNIKYSMDEFSLVKVDDVTSPDCLITSDVSETISDPVPVTFNFKEAVTGFDASDIVVENGTITAFVEVATSTMWIAEITPTDFNKVTTIDVNADAAQDAAGNGNNVAVQLRINDSATGISTSTFDRNISVYPNPSTGIFNLEINENSSAVTLSVVDLTGQVVWQKQVAGSQINETIDLSSVSKGYYLLKISNNTASTTKSIVVK